MSVTVNEADVLTGPGGPFEIVEEEVRGRQMRVFARARGPIGNLFGTMPVMGARDFIVSGARRLSYQQFHAQAGSLAALLMRDCGIRPGDRVAIAMHNSPEWMIAFMAVSAIDAIPALINSRGAADEMAHCAREVAASLAIVDERRAVMLGAAVPALPLLMLDETALSGAVDRYPHAPLPPSAANTDDAACILFTSGTTGSPKGATITHRAMLTGLVMAQHAGARFVADMAKRLGISADAITANRPPPAALLVFPLFHVSGVLSVFLGMMARGGKIVILPRWSAGEALRLFEEERVTEFTGPPMTLRDLMDDPTFARRDLSALGSVATGGQALTPAMLAELQRAFPNRVFGGGYGMTETTGSVSLAMGEAYTKRPECSGIVHDVVEMRIADEDGGVAAAGGIGELQVRGPMVMAGYWGRPEETAAVIDAEGWLSTGDIGTVDEHGYVTIVDRKTNMVICKGENIYCAEVERVLSAHPDIADVAAYGVPDPRTGERLAVAVVPRPGRTVTTEGVREHAARHLAPYKVPVEVHLRETPLTRNASGKIDRRALMLHEPQ